MVVEELTKRHHCNALQIPSETSANQMYVNPSIVFFGHELFEQYVRIFLGNQMEQLPFFLENLQRFLTVF